MVDVQRLLLVKYTKSIFLLKFHVFYRKWKSPVWAPQQRPTFRLKQKEHGKGYQLTKVLHKNWLNIGMKIEKNTFRTTYIYHIFLWLMKQIIMLNHFMLINTYNLPSRQFSLIFFSTDFESTTLLPFEYDEPHRHIDVYKQWGAVLSKWTHFDIGAVRSLLSNRCCKAGD